MNDWLEANPNPTSQDLSNFVENQFTESQLPTAFKYPVIHFKLSSFPVGLCEPGVTSGRSVTQLYLASDGCAHFKVAQPGTDARLDTAGAANVLIKSLRVTVPENGIVPPVIGPHREEKHNDSRLTPCLIDIHIIHQHATL